MIGDVDRAVVNVGPNAEQSKSALERDGSHCWLRDPRPRRGDRGSSFARACKQSQAVIVSGVSFEATLAAR